MQSNGDQTQAYDDRSNDQSSTYRTVTVPEAAKLLGISPEAVRARIQRGTLHKDKAANGTVYVRLYADQTRSYGDGTVNETADQSGDRAPLVASLEEQVSFLRAELVTRNEELRRKDHIIAALTERIPELPAPATVSQGQEPREGTEPGSREPSSTNDAPTTVPQDPVERPSWWRRFFGLE